VWLYHRFTLSFRDVEELLAARGISVTYETVRNWCLKFGNQYCSQIRKKRGQLGDTWYLDEVFVKINGVLLIFMKTLKPNLQQWTKGLLGSKLVYGQR
jgi:putative transposase